jgi:CBS domain-containing protein
MLVSDIMSERPVSITPEETVSLASRLMSRHNIGSLPVCRENSELVGVITDRDIVLRCVAQGADPDTLPVGQIMSRCIITVSPSDEAAVITERMGKGQVRRLPVVEDGLLVGMVSLGDMAQICVCNMETSEALCEISMNLKNR